MPPGNLALELKKKNAQYMALTLPLFTHPSKENYFRFTLPQVKSLHLQKWSAHVIATSFKVI